MVTRKQEQQIEQLDDIQDFPRPRRQLRSWLPKRSRPASVVPRKLVGLKSVDAHGMARGLGWFSLAIGLAELVAPKALQKLVGVRRGDHSLLIRALGLRQFGHGIAILSARNPATGVLSRLGGDAIDLSVLGAAFNTRRVKKDRLKAATAAVAGVTAVDAITAAWLSQQSSVRGGAVRVKRSVTINRSPEELYRFWQDFENLPRFMRHLISVKELGDGRSRWMARGPAGATVEWKAEVTQDRPNDVIAWRSLEGADVHNAGSVRFEPAPGGRGTVVRVELEYWPPGGRLGASVAKLFGEEPGQQLQSDLRRFKQVMETGEVVRSEAALQGYGPLIQRAAQPPSGDRVR